MYRVWSQRQPVQPLAERIEEHAEIVVGGDGPDQFDELPNCSAAIVGTAVITAEVLDVAPKLAIVSRTGVGYDKVDVAAATERNVAVAYTPDAPTISTAEHALMLLFAAAKKVKKAEHKLRNTRGRDLYKEHDGVELHGRTLGVVGYGRIGRHVARVAQAAGMRIVAYDPFIGEAALAGQDVKLVGTREELLAEADFITLHVPSTPETAKMINRESIAATKDGAFLINASRGALVDEAALLEGLESGKLAGAALDVTDPEPPSLDNPLLWREDVIVTPHIGSATGDGKLRIMSDAVDNVVRALRGEQPRWLVNPDVWPKALERLRAE